MDMITLLVLGVIVTAALALLFNAMTQTGIVENRRDVVGDGRIALERLTKQIRQATTIHTQTPTTLDLDTFINGVKHRVQWQAAAVSGTGCPCELSETLDGGSPNTVSSLLTYRNTSDSACTDGTPPCVFSYNNVNTQLNDIQVVFILGTKPTTSVQLTSDVELRNLND